MSRSYKHTPVYKTTKAGNKGKKFANRRIRRKAKITPDDIQIGKSNYYRRLNESWDICDYRFWENLYGGRNHIVILEIIRNFGRNAIEESER